MIGRSTSTLTDGDALRVSSGARGRVVWIDLARTAALAAMILFHFVRDLELFALIPQGTTLSGGWAVFARAIAASFLFLTGVSLVLAHRDRFRAQAWTRRFAVISGAALVITLATYAAFPSRFIYFGILHAIAACSLLSLPFLFAPAWVAALSAISVFSAAIVLGQAWALPIWLAWTGLSSNVPPALDFIPIFPWYSAVLLGVAVAKVFEFEPRTPNWGHAYLLSWPGRHSLAVYLLHQPILLALLWLFSRLA